VPQESYRCAKCVDTVQRCVDCRRARQDAVNARRARRRAEKLCIVCGAKVVRGLTRCERHRRENARISAASHARTRAG